MPRPPANKSENPPAKAAARPASRPARIRLTPEFKARAARIQAGLLKLYPDAHCALNHRNAFELLIATILSAQCTDVRVNMVTPALFERFPDPASFAKADIAEVEGLIRSTGFYHNKAKSIIGASKLIVEKFGHAVPSTMEELLQLPGVARKTANVVLGNAFGQNVGFVVDTHIGRLSQRLGLSRNADPVKVEQDLIAAFPGENWTMLAHLLIYHGRQVCEARKPRCEQCAIAGDCPKVGVTKK